MIKTRVREPMTNIPVHKTLLKFIPSSRKIAYQDTHSNFVLKKIGSFGNVIEWTLEMQWIPVGLLINIFLDRIWP